jgi:hypothetical protein
MRNPPVMKTDPTSAILLTSDRPAPFPEELWGNEDRTPSFPDILRPSRLIRLAYSLYIGCESHRSGQVFPSRSGA